jgi:hypothetical protein
LNTLRHFCNFSSCQTSKRLTDWWKLSGNPGCPKMILFSAAWFVVLNVVSYGFKSHRFVKVDEGWIFLHVHLQLLVQTFACLYIYRGAYLMQRADNLLIFPGRIRGIPAEQGSTHTIIGFTRSAPTSYHRTEAGAL